ncbi:hypothetical protein BC830DRAFT_658963 [Chytriomyces sp. MP71]|nr:hypothetical protein BC830DRAFT_658963 [Chytriomyces sp. MP71]
MEKKQITAAMLNQFRAENAETKLSVGLSGTHQSLNDHSKEFLLPIESVSNLGLQKSCTGSSLCLDDLRKEFLNGPNSLVPTTRILKSENIAKPSNGESTSHMVPSHDSLHESTGPKKVLRWDKTQVYVFEQSEEESLLRGDSASKKDKKRDLMRI